MAEFVLDTSGDVRLPDDIYDHVRRARFGSSLRWEWPDLSPLEQGVLEAASEAASRLLGRPVGFADWSGEALAAILKDCAVFTAALPDDFQYSQSGWERRLGAQFWAERNGGSAYSGSWSAVHTSELDAITDNFPLRTASLDDDGKVRFA